jgi:hypothetical protein
MSATSQRFFAALALPPSEAPLTRDERLQAIERLHERVNGYVKFIALSASMQGSSAEAKENAVAAFYARLTVLERQLGRICEELQLG